MSNNLEEVATTAKKHGLQLQPDSFTLNESGLDFQVVIATDEDGAKWILRLPRRDDVFVRTTPEKVVLDFIRERTGFEVPHWEIYTEELIAYKALSGVPSATIDMEKQAYVWEINEKNLSDQFVESLAKSLVELHSIPTGEAVDAGIEVQSIREVRDRMKERMDTIKETYGVGAELWERWQKWLHEDELWPDETALIHGDLHPGHILVDENEHVTGLIDWTEAKVADLSKDFLGHLTVFGEEELERLIHAYIEAGGNHWPKMKEHIIELNATSAIDIAEFAAVSGLKEYEEMAKQALGVEEE